MLKVQRLTLFTSFLCLNWAFGRFCAQATESSSPPAPTPSFTGCPVAGAVLPRPTALGKSEFFIKATENITNALDAAVSSEIEAGWDVKNTSFSVSLITGRDGNEDGGDDILWEYHHRGERNVNGTKVVDGNSQYLIGSVSKVFSDILLLKSGIDMEDPITKYLPQLKGDGSSPIKWDNVTLGAMSEHLAGIPSNAGGAFDMFFLKSVYEAMGFPPLEERDYPQCGILGLNDRCSKEELLESLLYMNPTTLPYSRPTYSSLSFNLFAWALEASTGKNYSELLDEEIISPLKLANTGVSPGDDSKAVIPPIEEQGWGTDYGYSAPGGGLYSSLNDLSSLVSSILDYSILETPSDVRHWLQPRGMTSSPSTLVGQPWEIQRIVDLDPEHPHTIDIFGKSGGANGYISQIAVIDQYGIGFVLLTAGPVDISTAAIIYDAVISSIIPAVEKETRKRAKTYVGNFTSPSNDNHQKDAPIIMQTSMNKRPGLKLDRLTRNGSDILEGIQKIWSATLPMIGALGSEFRLYPTGVESTDPDDKSLTRQDWRINFDVMPPSSVHSDLPGQGKVGDICMTWQTVDWLYYGGEPVDRIVFIVDKEAGEVVGVDVPFLRSGLLERAK